MKICLTANSGGHLNQLLQLEPLYKRYNCFFITDKNSFSEELSKTKNVYFVEKFVFKEILLKHQYFKPIKNLIQSLIVFRKESPDVIITTGAGSAFGSWILGKLFKKTIFIESIARTREASTFGKFFGSKSDKVFVQWESMLTVYKNATNAGLIFNFENKQTDADKQTKKMFITVGTYKLQFNRLLMQIDNLIEKKQLDWNIIAQIGASTYIPKHYDHFDYCGQKELHAIIDKSDLVLCQGGSGSIMDSLLRGKRVVAIPRLIEYKEFFDNHQIQLVRELEKLGLIRAVHDMKKLGSTIQEIENFKPHFQNLNVSKHCNYLMEYFEQIKEEEH